MFVAARSQECSTFVGDDCDGTTESQLLANAVAIDAQYTTHTVAVDGENVAVTEVLTPLLKVILPRDNVFGLTGRPHGVSAAHGWVVLLNALPRGTHTIVIHLAAGGVDSTTSTTVVVV
jgi:hypothetical protein